MSLRGQVRAHAYMYTREPSHNNTQGQYRDSTSPFRRRAPVSQVTAVKTRK
jgi:hypothetical protein